MYGFIVKKAIILNHRQFVRHYLPGQAEGESDVSRIYIDCGGEGRLVKQAHEAEAKKAGTFDQFDANAVMGVVQESQLLAWSLMPPRLGRVSAKLVTPSSLHQHEEVAPIAMQCAMLKALKPQQKHFRIAIVNAFGTNLGDCVLGMTALRVLAKELEQHLSSVVIDLLLGASSSPGNLDIVGHEPFVGKVKFSSPTLKEFADYDAYFDFTGLLTLPRFNEMPIVDWYLWWMGLDPSAVDQVEKRNKISLRPTAYTLISNLLKPYQAKYRVLFNFKASVALRSCPESVAVKLLRKLLAKEKEAHYFITTKLDIQHARVHYVGDITQAGTERFNALMAQIDAILSVDTYSIHAADAFNVPVVGLYASVHPEVYPYYPLHKGLLIPSGESLKGFRKSKLTEEEWNLCQGDYTRAWSNFDVVLLLKSLDAVMHIKKGITAKALHFIDSEVPLHRVFNADGALRYELLPDAWRLGVQKQLELMPFLSKQGSHAWVIAPGKIDFPIALAKKIGQDGSLRLFEPRPLRLQAIMQAMQQSMPQLSCQAYESLPLSSRFVEFATEDPLSQTSPQSWGNSKTQRKLTTVDVSDWQNELLSSLYLFAPTPFAQVLKTLESIIKRNKPNIGCAPVKDIEELKSIAQILHPLDYQFWVSDYLVDGIQYMALIALPNHIKVNATGLRRIVVK